MMIRKIVSLDFTTFLPVKINKNKVNNKLNKVEDIKEL